MDKRVLLATVVSMGVVLAWIAVFGKPKHDNKAAPQQTQQQPVANANPATAQAAAEVANKPEANKAEANKAGANKAEANKAEANKAEANKGEGKKPEQKAAEKVDGPPAPPAPRATPVETTIEEPKQYKVTFTSEGAAPTHWVLLDPQYKEDKPRQSNKTAEQIDLVRTRAPNLPLVVTFPQVVVRPAARRGMDPGAVRRQGHARLCLGERRRSRREALLVPVEQLRLPARRHRREQDQRQAGPLLPDPDARLAGSEHQARRVHVPSGESDQRRVLRQRQGPAQDAAGDGEEGRDRRARRRALGRRRRAILLQRGRAQAFRRAEALQRLRRGRRQRQLHPHRRAKVGSGPRQDHVRDGRLHGPEDLVAARRGQGRRAVGALRRRDGVSPVGPDRVAGAADARRAQGGPLRRAELGHRHHPADHPASRSPPGTRRRSR